MFIDWKEIIDFFSFFLSEFGSLNVTWVYTWVVWGGHVKKGEKVRKVERVDWEKSYENRVTERVLEVGWELGNKLLKKTKKKNLFKHETFCYNTIQ